MDLSTTRKQKFHDRVETGRTIVSIIFCDLHVYYSPPNVYPFSSFFLLYCTHIYLHIYIYIPG